MNQTTGQLLSTRINQLAGEGAGHNNETAHYEMTFDNPLDVGATKICMLINETKLCFAVLDNGPGIGNIWHLFGEGDGLKIKSGGKIGSKIAGELAAGTFFQADRTLYFSCCNKSVGRRHEQLNVQYNKMVEIVKTPDIDMTIANTNIREGPYRLVRKPEPDVDKFDRDNVEYVKELFENNECIMKYFDDTNITGMLKVFTYEEENKARFEDMMDELPKILAKAEFITYNTLTGFSGPCKEFKYINVVTGITRNINQESCKENFILGRDAIIYEDDEEYDENHIYDEIFGIMSEKVLSITNYFYEKNGKTYNRCQIDNYDEEFLIRADQVTKDGKVAVSNKATQLNKVSDSNLLNIISDDANLIGQMQMYMSFVSIDEAEEQKDLMNEASTIESMKQAYVYYNGRYLARNKLNIAGIQERSLPHFRILICINDDTTKYMNIRAQKSSISLSDAHPLIIKTIQEIIKPIICKLYEKDGNMIKDGIDDWDNYRDDVLSLINTGKLVIVPNPKPEPKSEPEPEPNPVLPGWRGPAEVHPSLNKMQTIAYLKKLKNTLNLGQKYKTKKDKSKLITILNNIERELILDDNMMDEKIDSLIEMLTYVEKTPTQAILHAPALQKL